MFWRTRDAVTRVVPALFAGLAITALYFFAASLVFPDDLGRRKSLDEYFMAEKGRVIGAILVAVALTYAYRLAVLPWSAWRALPAYIWVAIALIYLVGPVAAVTKRREVAIACLAVLLAIDLLDPVETLLWPN